MCVFIIAKGILQLLGFLGATALFSPRDMTYENTVKFSHESASGNALNVTGKVSVSHPAE